MNLDVTIWGDGLVIYRRFYPENSPHLDAITARLADSDRRNDTSTWEEDEDGESFLWVSANPCITVRCNGKLVLDTRLDTLAPHLEPVERRIDWRDECDALETVMLWGRGHLVLLMHTFRILADTRFDPNLLRIRTGRTQSLTGGDDWFEVLGVTYDGREPDEETRETTADRRDVGGPWVFGPDRAT